MESQFKSTGKGGQDVLDVNNSATVGGGVGDTFGEDAATEEMTLTPWTRLVARYFISFHLHF
jgi:malate dehydrogenase (oxaloacetate-decarboxylating)(NADP+)